MDSPCTVHLHVHQILLVCRCFFYFLGGVRGLSGAVVQVVTRDLEAGAFEPECHLMGKVSCRVSVAGLHDRRCPARVGFHFSIFFCWGEGRGMPK